MSDPGGSIASPLTILEHQSRQSDAARILQEAANNRVELILVGEALDIEGQVTQRSRKARRLAAAIREAGELPVKMWEESGSTQAALEARRALGLGRKQRAAPPDAQAAAVILQSYLDHLRMEAKE